MRAWSLVPQRGCAFRGAIHGGDSKWQLLFHSAEPRAGLLPLQSCCCPSIWSDFPVFVVKWQETGTNGGSEIPLNAPFRRFPF